MFWLSLIGLTLFVALICFYPLLKPPLNTQHIVRETLNKAFYFDRLKEIEQDEQQGLLDNTAPAKIELQQALLEDIPEKMPTQSTVQHTRSFGKIWFISGFLTLSIIASCIYYVTGAWQEEALVEKITQKLPHFYARIKDEETNPLNEQELQEFATALRIHLQQSPQEAKSWFLLGQIAINLENMQLAYDSYAKANQLAPQNVDYALSYARILMNSAEPTDQTQGEILLKQIIAQDHKNLDALSLLALNYFGKENYKMAIVTWAMMLRLMPQDDPRINLIEKSIKTARDALEEQETKKHQQLVPKIEN